jgi:Ca2+:H+ antiporter
MHASRLLVAVPIAMLLDWLEAPPMVTFLASILAILPLVGLMGHATEALAAKLGHTVGGLLNSTLINLPELIIGGVALSKGLTTVVKASLTGAILANLLVSLGIALIVGGRKYGVQKFDPRRLSINSSMLLVCAFCFIVPAVFNLGTPEGTRDLSFEMSFVLLGIYCANVIVTIFTHEGGTDLPRDEMITDDHPDEPLWKGFLKLAVSAGFLAVVSEVMSDALTPTARMLGLSDTFSGLVLLGGMGTLGEILASSHFARQGRPSLVLSSTVGSTIQLVLLVAPLLVFLGPVLGQPMDLMFTSFEVVSIVLASTVARELIRDGQGTWFEGLLLLGVYAILAIGFYHLPG